MSDELSGSRALVTGATSGIGRATALEIASMGAHVIVSGRDHHRGERTVEAIRAAGGRADFIAADLVDAESARTLASRSIAAVGQIDILVNNAGVMGPSPTDPDQAEAVFDRFFGVNVKAPYFLVDSLAPAMAERGHGVIVNVASMAALIGMVPMALYGSTKSALLLLTKAWAAQYGPFGVRVNAVSPGPTHTDGTERFKENHEQMVTLSPARRVGRPEEIAHAIAFLASDRSSYIDGAVLPVDGGRTAV